MAALVGPVGTIESTPFLWLGSIAMVVVGVGATRKVPAYWRGGEIFDRTRRVFEPFGEPLATALASVVPVAAPACLLFGAIALVLVAREVTSGVLQQAMELVGSLLVLPTAATLLVMFAVVLFGRPRLLVPPPLREHRGIVGEYLARVRSFRETHGPDRD
jgi:hypothetical protein